MPDAAWKAHEREIVRRLGGQRAGPTGKASADVLHPLLAVECKERQSLPAWLRDAMRQARAAAAGTEKTPVVVLHQLSTRHDGDVVCLRLQDFERMITRRVFETTEGKSGA